MSTKAKEESLPRKRLDSWKSVAAYLNRSCRTVQRWNRKYGLPIHHLAGIKGSVFAYPPELDEWLRGRGRLVKSEPVDTLEELSQDHVPRSIDPIKYRGSPNPSLVSSLDRMRSADLLAVAEQMRATLSDTNMGTIAQTFRKAVDLDPFNVEAFAGFAHALITEVLWSSLCPQMAYPLAKAALHRALEIEPESPEVSCAVAWLKMLLERDWQGATRGFDDALQRHPTTRALIGRAFLYVAQGCPKKSSALLGANTQGDALSTPLRAGYCWSEYLGRDYTKALEQISQARASGYSGLAFDTIEALAAIQAEKPPACIRRIETLAADSPGNDVLQGAMGFAYAASGQTHKASDTLTSIMQLRKHGHHGEPYAIALILIGMNDWKNAVQWLGQAYTEGSFWSLGFPCDPILEPLKDNADYQLFLRKANYPDCGFDDPHTGQAAESNQPGNERIHLCS